jgi:uncharacterized membrane protein YjjP (DUF1212 family)
LEIRFLSELFASLCVGVMGVLAVHLHLAHGGLLFVLIGGVMPYLPGVAITNSLRDLLAGDLLSGVARGAEALITLAMLGIGVGIMMYSFG